MASLREVCTAIGGVRHTVHGGFIHNPQDLCSLQSLSIDKLATTKQTTPTLPWNRSVVQGSFSGPHH